jgi:type I restriction enzyme M protein
MTDALLDESAALLQYSDVYVTPKSLRRLIVGLAEPFASVYDPAVGSGQLMVDAAASLKAPTIGDAGIAQLSGQEVDSGTWAMAQLNLAIHGVHADIAIGDVFSEDHFPQLRADRVITAPPWNQRLSIEKISKSDPRWIYGEPGSNDGNAAWIQHCLYHLADGGRAVLVLPNNALFEVGRAGRIRQRIIKAGLLDAVVALPPGLFAWSPKPAAILVFSKSNVDRSGGPASLMIDLSQSGEGPGKQSTVLGADVIEQVIHTYRAWVAGEPPDIENASVARFDDIAANDFVLVPARYQSVVHDSPDADEARSRKRDLRLRLENLSAASRDADDQLGKAFGSTETSSFRQVRLGDLSSAVTIARGFPTHRAVSGGTVPVMSIADLRNGSTPRHFADHDAIWDTGLTEAVPGDVLLAIEGGTVGETMVVAEGSGQFVPSQQVAILRVADTAVIDPWYLGAWFATEQARAQLLRLASGAAIQRVRIRDLQSLTVKLPPLSRQREIGQHFLAFDRAIEGHRAVAVCLEDLRDVELVVAFSDIADGAAHPTSA